MALAVSTRSGRSPWDETTDITPGSNIKNRQTFICPAITEVKVQAIVRRLGFGNFTGRGYPERVETIVEFTIAQRARTAEVLGAARDLLHVFSQVASNRMRRCAAC